MSPCGLQRAVQPPTGDGLCRCAILKRYCVSRLLTAVFQTMVRQASTDAAAEDAKALGGSRVAQRVAVCFGKALGPKGCPLMALFESLDPTNKVGLLPATRH